MEKQQQDGAGRTSPEKISLGQKLFDNMFLLLIISLLINFVIYNLWGLIETLSITPAP